jgi:hypothetical protein
MSDAISAHGTKVEVQMTPGGAFDEIGEIGGDIVPPSLSRNAVEVTTHNDDIDAYIAGVLRRGEMTFPINFIASGTQLHDETTGLYKLIIDNTKTGFKVTFPDNDFWIFSGYVTNIAKRAPVDGALTADVTIRPTGPMIINVTDLD